MGQLILMIMAALLSSFCAPIISGQQRDGFRAFASARSFDPPGSIYRVDPDGVVWQVTQSPTKVYTGHEVWPKFSDDSEFSLREVFETIGIPATVFPVNVTANIEKKRHFVTESINGTRDWLTDREVDQILEDALKGIKIRPDNQYYVIRETVLTDNISFTSDASWTGEIATEGKIKELVKNKADLKWTSDRQLSLIKKFDKPMRYWYKAELLSFERPIGMGPGQSMILLRTGKSSKALQVSGPVRLMP